MPAATAPICVYPMESEAMEEKKLQELLEDIARQISGLRKDVRTIRKAIFDERKPCFTNAEVMEMFGVSTQTVKLWRDTGSIGYAKIGLRYIYTREDIARFIEEFHYKPDDYGNS